MKKKLLNTSGFTMLELLLAIAIFSIIVIPTFNMLLMSSQINNSSHDEIASITDAERAMETFKSLGDTSFNTLNLTGIETPLNEIENIFYKIYPVDKYSISEILESTVLYKMEVIKYDDSNNIIQHLYATKLTVINLKVAK